MSVQGAEFDKIRAFFWPIHRHEVKKVVPMMIMLFLICFNYTILRNVKDAIIVTAPSSGAHVLPFIKVWVLLPLAVLFTIIFTKLSNRFSQEKVFYITITFFLVFYALFTFVFFPLQTSLHPHQLADKLQESLPAGFKGLIGMFRNWTFTLFYVMSELWGSMVLSVLFWGFANEITKITEARRFYSMLGVIASLSGTVAALAGNYILTLGFAWEKTLDFYVTIIITSGCVTMATFWWMNKNVLKGPSFEDLHETIKPIKINKKLSIWESFSYLSNSKYLMCIAALVLGYNLVINLVEVVWKDQLKQLHSAPEGFTESLNNMTIGVGVIATLLSLFMPKMIARFGWSKTAQITPVTMLITSAGFFTFMLFRYDWAETVYMLTGTTPLVIAVFFGAAQVCMSKACKYSVFDATKEMAFIPLSHECKLKGKAAIDGVGSRLGKSGGSLIHQGLLMIFASVSTYAPYVAIILLLVIIGWMIAVRALAKQFAAIVDKQGREEIGEEKIPSEDLETAKSA